MQLLQLIVRRFGVNVNVNGALPCHHWLAWGRRRIPLCGCTWWMGSVSEMASEQINACGKKYSKHLHKNGWGERVRIIVCNYTIHLTKGTGINITLSFCFRRRSAFQVGSRERPVPFRLILLIFWLPRSKQQSFLWNWLGFSRHVPCIISQEPSSLAFLGWCWMVMLS